MASSGNFGTWNPLNIGSGGTTSLTVGNTNAVMTGADPRTAANVGGVISDTDGYYFETVATSAGSGALTLGIINEDRHNQLTSGQIHSRSGSFMWRGYDGGAFFVETSSNTSYGTFTDGDVLGWYVKNSKLYVKKNNSDVVGDVVNTSGGIDISGGFFFPAVSRTVGGGAQTSSILRTDSDDWSYSPPDGFKGLTSKDMLVDSNIDPAGDDGADDNSTKQCGPVLYSGNGGSNAITGLGFQPDLVWMKQRSSGSTFSNGVVDSSRGASLGTYFNRTDADTDFSSDFSSFDSDGFTLASGSAANINNSGVTFIGWGWKANGGTTSSNSDGSITSSVQANTKAGFSIVTYTGGGSSGTVGHGLDKAPEFVISKKRSGTQSWFALATPFGQGYFNVSGNASYSSGNDPFNSSAPTTTVVGASGDNVTSSATYIYYCWHSVEGFQKFGKYEGNGNADGTFVYTGFKPKMLVIKDGDNSERAWVVYDDKRNTFNPVQNTVGWNLNGSEDTSSYPVDFLSNGFKLRTTNNLVNASSTYFYACWGSVPFRYNNTF
jgi:hypothetical protein